MNRFFYILPICLSIIFSFASISQADVVLEDVRVNNNITMNESFTTGTFETGEGNQSDYILSACAVSNTNGGNTFSLPTPGDWTELDQGECGTGTSCIGGVWGRFALFPESTLTTCSWSSQFRWKWTLKREKWSPER